jgi:hypothetical protein
MHGRTAVASRRCSRACRSYPPVFRPEPLQLPTHCGVETASSPALIGPVPVRCDRRRRQRDSAKALHSALEPAPAAARAAACTGCGGTPRSRLSDPRKTYQRTACCSSDRSRTSGRQRNRRGSRTRPKRRPVPEARTYSLNHACSWYLTDSPHRRPMRPAGRPQHGLW